MIPFTTYYYSKIDLTIDDSIFSLPGILTSSRSTSFVTYKWHRSGFDAVESYYDKQLEAKNGKMIEQFSTS